MTNKDESQQDRLIDDLVKFRENFGGAELVEDLQDDDPEAPEAPTQEPRVEHISVPEEGTGMRLDTFLSRRQSEYSRTYFQQLIKDGRVSLNEKQLKGSELLQAGDQVVIHFPPAEQTWPAPQDLPLEVLYHNDHIILVNKATGMITHPAPGNPDGTLVNALLHRFPDLPGINGVKRPGIVHRLDRETSGVLVVAKTDLAMKNLSNQIKDRRMSRLYVALMLGTPDWEEKTVEAPIGRHADMRVKRQVNGIAPRDATTHFRVLLRMDGFSFVRCQLETGRTHQIRVHAQHMGFPIVADDLYGGISHRSLEKLMNGPTEKRRVFQGLKRTFLHARVLTFQDPQTQKWVSASAPLPADLLAVFNVLFPGIEAEAFINEHVHDERERDSETTLISP
ncbi:MAG: RluA family pseudouridine synthase [Sumerlaeia bacterium]